MSVTSVNTTLANGTDNQVFCYDSLNHLIWAGSTGTPNCSRTLMPGTLSAANYTATYSYDASNRITGGSLGTLSYGDSAHFHAATSSSSGETASYDAAGDMQCRAPTSAVTCAGASPTGASLNYDAERRLSHWQNAQTNPTVQAWYLYDGSGQRVEQYVSGGSGNHTYCLPGGVEEVTPSGSLIKYYSAGGMLLGLNTARDASGISYLASDGLGSVSEALSQSGTATGAVLYSPYGGVRYTSGTMPTSKGFTGQYADTASSGLDYYGARYYDPSLGQFTSADTVADGINRYGYVKGSPETATDPTGHRMNCKEIGDCSSPRRTPPPPPSGGCGEPDLCQAPHDSATSTSKPGCGHLYGCTGTYTIPKCSGVICHSGSDGGNGLWSLLLGEFGDAKTLTVNGIQGINRLISLLETLETNGNATFDDLLSKVSTGIDILSVIGGIAGAILGSPGGLVGGGVTAAVIAGGVQIEGAILKQMITDVKSQFDHMVQQTIAMLNAVVDDVSNWNGGQGATVYATSHVEVSVSTVGPGNFAGAWMAQGFFVEADMQQGPYSTS